MDISDVRYSCQCRWGGGGDTCGSLQIDELLAYIVGVDTVWDGRGHGEKAKTGYWSGFTERHLDKSQLQATFTFFWAII